MDKLTWKRVWHFIWYEDSIWSWIANIVLSIILIKYVLFPFLGFVLGTQFPIVAVVSTSMEHDGSFDDWWSSSALCTNKICTQEEYYSQFNITKEQFNEFSFNDGFNKGDVMVLSSAKSAELGDVIVFFAKDGRPIIHRMIAVDPIETKGDHNKAQITTNLDPAINEKNVDVNTIIGKASFRIPLIGYVKIMFASLLSLFGIRVA